MQTNENFRHDAVVVVVVAFFLAYEDFPGRIFDELTPNCAFFPCLLFFFF